jgi:hydroxymethylbilane synthase
VLGTRGSALALAQAELVKQALHNVQPDLSVETRIITTSGDRNQQVIGAKISGAGLKGMFTREIEAALLSGEIDAAVHSLKDLPGQLPPELEVIAVLERADTGDVLISKNAASFEQLPRGAWVGTNSVRRRKQLLWMRPDLVIEEIRGNVPTRLRKLCDNDQLEGVVLAQAGLQRLGFTPNEAGELKFENAHFKTDVLQMLPAIGQGAIALEARKNDERTRAILSAINHAPTFLCIRAERELLRLLDGDCNLPVGVKTTLVEQSQMRIQTILFSDGNESPRTSETEGDAFAPEILAQRLFKQLYAN